MIKLLKNPKFWTLVAALVAAASAFFLESCSSKVHVVRSGVHVDTVRIDLQAKTNNANY
ncbi:hypothetical protein [Peromfec virus RodF5_8]|uniref:Uncharacterized protein n=1 Tax=Peromfec virus RodF5_8 TaxID=2929344 RepID=A0A976N341_9VIRU|nr:hypothetical protein [Peromfec virus RodF5_8]